MYNENVLQIHSRSLFIQKENEIMKCMELGNTLREVIQTHKDNANALSHMWILASKFFMCIGTG